MQQEISPDEHTGRIDSIDIAANMAKQRIEKKGYLNF